MLPERLREPDRERGRELSGSPCNACAMAEGRLPVADVGVAVPTEVALVGESNAGCEGLEVSRDVCLVI